MTINLEGALHSPIVKTEWVSKGKKERTCCVCHQIIVQKKMKVLADLSFPRDDWRVGKVKQFFFCHPCFQGLRVYQASSMHEIETKVGSAFKANYELEGTALCHGDLVRSTIQFGVYTNPDGHLTMKRNEGDRNSTKIGLIILGITENKEYVWLYHPDYGPIQIWAENFGNHFVRVKDDKRVVLSAKARKREED